MSEIQNTPSIETPEQRKNLLSLPSIEEIIKNNDQHDKIWENLENIQIEDFGKELLTIANRIVENMDQQKEPGKDTARIQSTGAYEAMGQKKEPEEYATGADIFGEEDDDNFSKLQDTLHIETGNPLETVRS